MSRHHLVRCDGPGCAVEEPLMATVSTITMAGYPSSPQTEYRIPSSGWQQIAGRDFCGWRCLAAYGQQQAEEQRA